MHDPTSATMVGVMAVRELGMADRKPPRSVWTRTARIAVAALLLLAAPAYAQMGGGKHHRDGDEKGAAQKPKVDEKAYKAALERIPDPKEKYDPWGVARAPDAAKIPSKASKKAAK